MVKSSQLYDVIYPMELEHPHRSWLPSGNLT